MRRSDVTNIKKSPTRMGGALNYSYTTLLVRTTRCVLTHIVATTDRRRTAAGSCTTGQNANPCSGNLLRPW